MPTTFSSGRKPISSSDRQASHPKDMRIPYVIDNQSFRLGDILSALLGEHLGQSFDIATAYFTVGGFGLIRDGLQGLGNLRLILGQEPASAEQVGLRPDAGLVKG